MFFFPLQRNCAIHNLIIFQKFRHIISLLLHGTDLLLQSICDQGVIIELETKEAFERFNKRRSFTFVWQCLPFLSECACFKVANSILLTDHCGGTQISSPEALSEGSGKRRRWAQERGGQRGELHGQGVENKQKACCHLSTHHRQPAWQCWVTLQFFVSSSISWE